MFYAFFKERFGSVRLIQNNGIFRKLFFMIFGAGADHTLRFLYFKKLAKLHVDFTKINRVLDAGCGGGDYSFYLANKYPEIFVTAIDINKNRIIENNKIKANCGIRNLKFQQKDLTANLDNDEYNLIISMDVLEHIPDQEKVLRSFFTSMKKNAFLFIHIPLQKRRKVVFHNMLKSFHQWAEEEHTAIDHTKKSFEYLLISCGFEIVESKFSFNHYFGELIVSIIMIFYNPSILNNILRALFYPLFQLLILLDMNICKKDGNALAVLVKKK